MKKYFTVLMALLSGFGAGWISNKVIGYIRAKHIAQEVMEEAGDSLTVCSLVIVHQFEQDNEDVVADFSKYEEKGQVGLIVNHMGENPEEEDEKLEIYPKAIVYQVEGVWRWKVL